MWDIYFTPITGGQPERIFVEGVEHERLNQWDSGGPFTCLRKARNNLRRIKDLAENATWGNSWMRGKTWVLHQLTYEEESRILQNQIRHTFDPYSDSNEEDSDEEV